MSYGALRVSLGIYLFEHAIANVLNYNEFVVESMIYFNEEGNLKFLSELAPLVPLMEFFIASMITLGLYTKTILKWAIGLGIFFTVFFHSTGDFQTALLHCYSLQVKIVLYLLIYYDKISLDFYNIWQVYKAAHRTKLSKP